MAIDWPVATRRGKKKATTIDLHRKRLLSNEECKPFKKEHTSKYSTSLLGRSSFSFLNFQSFPFFGNKLIDFYANVTVGRMEHSQMGFDDQRAKERTIAFVERSSRCLQRSLPSTSALLSLASTHDGVLRSAIVEPMKCLFFSWREISGEG